MALFSSKPFLFVRDIIDPASYRGMIQEGIFVRFPFSTRYQRSTSACETPEILINEFERMWSAADTKFWLEGGPRVLESKPLSWLR